MSYTKLTDFAVKDALLSGNPAKVIRGVEFDAEFNAIVAADALSTKAATLAASSGSSLVGFIQSGTGAVSTTVQSKLRERVSVSDFGAVGDGVTDDTAAIQKALAASLNVIIEGTFLVSGTGTLFNIRNDHHITFNATITHSTTSGIVFSADGVNDWVLDGNLAVYGAGNGNGSETALYVKGCNRYKVYNVLAANMYGWGIKIDPGAYVAPYADQGKFFGCTSYNCYYGLEGTPGTGAEFCEFHGYTSVLCTYGTVVEAGNWQFLGGHDVQNVNGFTLLGGSNNSHGMCVGRAFNHNSSYNFRANGATNGWVNVGCNAYADSLILGYIWITDSTGITWIGGNVDSPILMDGTSTYCKLSNANIPGTYTTISGARAQYLQVENCYTPSGGQWSYNDPAFCYVLANRASSTQTAAGGATIVFNNATKDNRSAYSDTTGTFTTPATGWYTVSVNLTITGTALAAGYAEIKKNGTTICYVPIVTANAGATIAVASASVDIALTAADTIIVTATAGGTTPLIAVDTSWISIASKG